MSEQLKPCPFCGPQNEEFAPRAEWYAIDGNTDDLAWRVACQGCCANTSGHGDSDDAVLAWNRRAPSAIVAALEREVRESHMCDEWDHGFLRGIGRAIDIVKELSK